ncbi:MAG: hypothetical protein M3198_04195 [Actinomycetota bacterium]|nr:hypothetical protein [Actinomycetota bacterium]
MAENGREEELKKQLEAAEQELAKLNSEIEAMKARVRDKLVAEWPSPWKNDQIVNTKVMGRLAGDKDYRALNERVREVDEVIAGINAELATLNPQDPAFQVEDKSKAVGYMPDRS